MVVTSKHMHIQPQTKNSPALLTGVVVQKATETPNWGMGCIWRPASTAFVAYKLYFKSYNFLYYILYKENLQNNQYNKLTYLHIYRLIRGLLKPNRAPTLTET